MLPARHFLIAGQVQGVGFRAFSQREARRLGLKGWVRNLNDGRVEVLAHGLEESLREFQSVLLKGPRLSEVSAVESKDVMVQESLTEFMVIETGDRPWSVLL